MRDEAVAARAGQTALDWSATPPIIQVASAAHAEGDVHVVGGAVRVAIAVLVGLVLSGARADAEPDFTVPERLRPQVEFWVSIFATYGKRQIVIHDTEDLQRIYTVLDLSDLDSEGLSETQIELAMREQETAEKERIRSLLWRLDFVDPRVDALTQEERRIIKLFAGDSSPSKFRDAAA